MLAGSRPEEEDEARATVECVARGAVPASSGPVGNAGDAGAARVGPDVDAFAWQRCCCVDGPGVPLALTGLAVGIELPFAAWMMFVTATA